MRRWIVLKCCLFVSGVLKHLETEDRFQFSAKHNDHTYNQMRYEAMGEVASTSQLSFSEREREREMFYLTTHSTHFNYGYMASDIWLRTILIVREETRCRHMGYSYRLTARVLLYAPSHRQDNTYHGLCYTSRGALAGTRNSSMGPPHEGSIRRPTAPMSERSTSELCPAPHLMMHNAHYYNAKSFYCSKTQ